MSDEKTKLSGPDLTKGVALSTRRRRRHAARARARRTGAPRATRRTSSSQSGDRLHALGARSPTDWSSGRRCAVPGITPASACAPAKRSARRRSTRFVLARRAAGRTVYVRSKDRARPARHRRARAGIPKSVVIVGGGAAGNAAAEMLRRLGYAGRITMFSADSSGPCDRPNLSKGYLRARRPRSPTRSGRRTSIEEQRIELKLDARVATIDTGRRHVQLADGTRHAYDALLLATGAEPVRLDVPGARSAARPLAAHARRQPRDRRQARRRRSAPS